MDLAGLHAFQARRAFAAEVAKGEAGMNLAGAPHACCCFLLLLPRPCGCSLSQLMNSSERSFQAFLPDGIVYTWLLLSVEGNPCIILCNPASNFSALKRTLLPLAEAALQIAAEDDAIVSHSVVPLPVGSFRKRIRALVQELIRLRLPQCDSPQAQLEVSPQQIFRT